MTEFYTQTTLPTHSPSLPAAATLWRCGDKNSGHFQPFFTYIRQILLHAIDALLQVQLS